MDLDLQDTDPLRHPIIHPRQVDTKLLPDTPNLLPLPTTLLPPDIEGHHQPPIHQVRQLPGRLLVEQASPPIPHHRTILLPHTAQLFEELLSTLDSHP